MLKCFMGRTYYKCSYYKVPLVVISKTLRKRFVSEETHLEYVEIKHNIFNDNFSCASFDCIIKFIQK